MKNTFSFEIYKDVSAADVSLEPVVAGINNLGHIIGNCDVVESNALLKFPEGDGERLSARAYGIQHMADFAVILTNKPIGDEDERTRGITYSYPDGKTLGLRNTIISTHDNLNVEATTEHEVGHLFNMVHGGENHDGNGHCNNQACLMHPSIERTKVITKNIYYDEMGNMNVVDVGTTEYTMKKALCQTCKSLFALNAEQLMDAKQGKEVEDKYIFAAMASDGNL